MITVKDAGIQIPRLPKPKKVDLALGLKYITEFYNKCHNPAGNEAGGQFCSDNVEYVNVSKKLKARLQKTMDAISKVHDVPDKFPKAYIEESDTENMDPNVDGFYDSNTDQIILNGDIPNTEATLVHEFGHHLSLAEEGNWSLNAFMDKVDRTPSLRKVIDSIYKSDTYQGIKEKTEGGDGSGFFSYLADEREAFARSYFQWIALRSGDKTLQRQLKENRDRNPNYQWYDSDFTPIAEALDEHFKTRENTTFKQSLLLRFNVAIQNLLGENG